MVASSYCAKWGYDHKRLASGYHTEDCSTAIALSISGTEYAVSNLEDKSLIFPYNFVDNLL